MAITFPPELETSLCELAAQAGQSPEAYLASLVSEKIAYESWFRESVAEGFVELDRGEFVTQEEVEKRFARYLKD